MWAGDITYIPLTGGGSLYLAVWMDLYSRKIIGWQLDSHMKEALIITAFTKALRNRKVTKELTIHSDRGGQYAGNQFRKMLHSYKLQQSMSRADNPYGNAFMESCFSRFKTELLQDGAFDNRTDAQTEIFEYIEMYYNTKGRHSSLGYQGPMTLKRTAFFTKPKQLHCPSKLTHIKFLTFEEACIYLGRSASSMYKLTSGRLIPYYVPTGKLIYFRKSEIDAWALRHKRKSKEEIKNDVEDFLLEEKTKKITN